MRLRAPAASLRLIVVLGLVGCRTAAPAVDSPTPGRIDSATPSPGQESPTSPVAPQAGTPPLSLVPRVPIRGELDSEEAERYSLALSGPSLVRAHLERRGIAADLRLLDPDGTLHVASDGGEGRWSRSCLTAQTDRGGLWQLDIAAAPDESGHGGYRLELDEVEPVGEHTAERLALERELCALVRAEPADEAGSAQRIVRLGEIARDFERLGLPGRRAEALYQLAELRFAAGDYDAARLLYEESLGISQSIGDVRQVARRHGDLALTLTYLRRLPEARLAIDRGLEQARSLGDREIEGFLYNNLGTLQYHDGDGKSAESSFDRAANLRARAGDRRGQIRALMNLGVTRQTVGETAEAFEAFAAAQQIAHAHRFEGLDLALELGIGTTYLQAGQADRALEVLNEGLQRARESHDPGMEQSFLVHVGNVYEHIGEIDKARRSQEEALAIAERIGDREARAWSLIQLSKLDLTNGEEERARRRLAAAKELAGDSITQAPAVERGLGLAYLAEDRPDLAIEHFAAALRLCRKGHLAVGEAEALRRLGQAYLRADRLEEAESVLLPAMERSRELGDLAREGAIHSQIARLRDRQGRPEEALAEIRKAIEIRERIRADLADPDLRASFLSLWRQDYALLIDLLIRSAEQRGDRSSAEAAFEASERAHSRVLHELLIESRIDLASHLTPDQTARRRSAEVRVALLQKELAEAASRQPPDEAELERLRGHLGSARDQRERIETEIRSSDRRYAEIHYPQTLDLTATQALLGATTALLEYALGEERSYLFVVTADRFAYHSLPPASEIADRVAEAMEGIATPLPQLWPRFRRTSSELYRALLLPAAGEIAGMDRLLIVPDRELHYLPFEILLIPRENGSSPLSADYLLQRWAVDYAPSASVYAQLIAPRPAPTAGNSEALVAFSDPSNIGQAPAVAIPGDEGEPARERGVSRLGIAALPGARDEVSAIATLFPAGEVRVFSGSEATEANLKSSDVVSRAVRLHLATHGFVDEQRPAYSYLLLGRDADGREDGLLQTHEIFDLRLTTDLVVLSACETGRGKALWGEGIIGLTGAFFYAGSRTVVVSLWKVADRSTADLMAAFYRYLSQGRSPSDALRRAKLDLLTGGRLEHPYHWAAFVVIGKG